MADQTFGTLFDFHPRERASERWFWRFYGGYLGTLRQGRDLGSEEATSGTEVKREQIVIDAGIATAGWMGTAPVLKGSMLSQPSVYEPSFEGQLFVIIFNIRPNIFTYLHILPHTSLSAGEWLVKGISAETREGQRRHKWRSLKHSTNKKKKSSLRLAPNATQNIKPHSHEKPSHVPRFHLSLNHQTPDQIFVINTASKKRK